MPFGGTDFGQDDESPVTVYSGTLFGASVTVELGRFPDVAYSDTDNCYWHVVAVKEGELDVDEYVEIDHEESSCLTPPGIEIGEIEGPDGCTGMLSLAPYEVDHLPFVMREIENFSIEGDAYPAEFIDLYPACGDCTQVCSVLCVYGHKTLGGVREFAEFRWFDDDPGGPATEASRGWEYTDPTTDVEYTIWLYEDAYGYCTLDFDWPGSAILEDRTIDLDRGCSCGIKEVVTAESGDLTIGFTIRCGYCTCWGFYCGTCRCVPRYLCAQTWIDWTFSANVILTWDEDELAWIDYDVGTAVAIHLQANETTGACELVPYIDGVALDSMAERDCGAEHRAESVETGGKKYDASNDFIVATFEDNIGYDNDEPVWISVSSLVDDCRVGPCDDMPCVDECGSHPLTLTATLHGWSDSTQGDEPGYDDITCDMEVELHYHEQFNWVGFPESTCGYIGFGYVGECSQLAPPSPLTTWVVVTVWRGIVNVARWATTGLQDNCILEKLLATETCDPYFGQTDVHLVPLESCCWACYQPDVIIQRYQITIVE